MRFKAVLRKNSVLYKVSHSLAQLSKLCWLRLDDESIRLTIVPEGGSQCWSVLNLETIFDAYDLSSNQPQNVINLEINAQNLHEALRSTLDTPSRQLALVKRQGTPYLCLTIRKISAWKRARQQQAQHQQRHPQPLHGEDPDAAAGDGDGDGDGDGEALLPPRGVPAAAEPPDDNATVIVHEIPVRVLKPERLAALHEPQIPDPDVFIHLPPLPALKAISDRYTRLASTSTSTSTSRPRPGTGAGSAGLDGQRAAKIDLAATMHGKLRLSLEREGVLALKSTWEGLENVRPAAEDLEGGEEALAMHPCTRMLEMGAGAEEERGEAAWARVRVDGRDWGRVLAVGKCGGDVVAGFCNGTCLVLYVYLRNPDDDGELDSSVLTYYITSFSMD